MKSVLRSVFLNKNRYEFRKCGLFVPLASVLFLINSQAEATNNAYDWADEITFRAGSVVNFGTGIIRSRGKVISYTDKVKLYQGKTMTIEAGDSEETGAYHNHGRLELYKGSKITGAGKVINYAGFQDDVANNALAEINKSNGGYKVEGYDAQTSITSNEDVQKATYFDLVNDEDLQVRKFKVYTGSNIYSTTKEVGAGVTAEDFTKVTGTNQGSADHGKIDPSITFETRSDELKQAETLQDTAYDLGSVKAYNDGIHEFIHSSDKKDEIKASFFSLPGFETAYTGGATKFEKWGNRTVPVYIPKVDENIVLGKTMPDTENATNYEQEIINNLGTTPETNPNLFAYTDWQDGDPVTTYSGSNSWFNGVYKLKRGAMIVTNKADMFGGRVELGDADDYVGTTGNGTLALHEDLIAGNETAKEFIKRVRPTEFEWQGGSKDEYNKPQIYLNGNSTLYFYIPEDQNGNKIFSFYGNITGTERDRMIFEQGEVRIKGDCSGFKGSVAVAQGAKFEVRKSDDTSSSKYEGKFPNANIYQIDTNGQYTAGASGTATEVDTANMENVTINNGNMELTNTGTDNEGKITLKSATVGDKSMTTLKGESEIKDTTIRGVVVANGNLRAENTVIQGGVLVLQGRLITNNLEAGSTIASWGNSNYGDKVTVGDNVAAAPNSSFKITDQHTLKFYSDFNVNNKNTDGTYESDTINAENANNVQAGGGIAVAGMNFNALPTENEYKFSIYSGSPSNMPITIGGKYGNSNDEVFDVYVGGKFQTNGEVKGVDNDIKYTYNQTNPDAIKVPTMLEDGEHFAEFGNGNIYKIIGDSSKGNVLLIKSLSSAATQSDVVQDAAISQTVMGLGSIVTDSDALLDGELSPEANAEEGLLSDKKQPGKYRLWNKTFGEHSRVDLKGTNDIKANEIGTMFGFDGEAQIFESTNTKWMPTVFAGLQYDKLKYKGTKYDINGYFGGAKLAIFDKKQSLEVFGIYELIKSKGTITRASTNQDETIRVKSHAINFGTKYEYNIDLKQGLYFRPNLSLNYAYVHTPSFSGYNNAKHKLNNRHLFDVAPGISLTQKIDTWSTRAFATYHRKFGTKGKTTASGVTVNTNLAKKQHLEYGLEVIKTNVINTAQVGFKLSRKTLGVKGFRATISAGLKF